MTIANEERPAFGDRIWPAKDGYNLVAASYKDWYWRPFWLKNEKPYIEKYTSLVANPNLGLDLGCGTGMYCGVLEERCSALGLDQSIEMLKLAKQEVRSETPLICAKISSIPIVSDAAEIAIVARALSHEKNLTEALNEIARVTKRNGICIVSEVHAQHSYPRTRIQLGNSDVHIETYKRDPVEVSSVARASGHWEIEECKEFKWDNILWQPDDPRFVRIDRSSENPIFYILILRRT